MPIPGRAETIAQKACVISELLDPWYAMPQLRLGQLIMCAIGDERDLFNMEDDELVRLVTEFAKEHA